MVTFHAALYVPFYPAIYILSRYTDLSLYVWVHLVGGSKKIFKKIKKKLCGHGPALMCNNPANIIDKSFKALKPLKPLTTKALKMLFKELRLDLCRATFCNVIFNLWSGTANINSGSASILGPLYVLFKPPYAGSVSQTPRVYTPCTCYIHMLYEQIVIQNILRSG